MELRSFDIRPEIYDLAEQKELGELRKVYSVAKQNTAVYIIGVLCLLIGILYNSFMLYIFFFVSPLHLIGLVVLGFIPIIVGCYIIRSRRIYERAYSRWHIYLWPYGFIYEKGRDLQVFRWDQIESVHIITLYIKIHRQDGYEFRLSRILWEGSELIDILLKEVASQLASQELKITPSRNIKAFNQARLDRQGIQQGVGKLHEAIAWTDMQEFMVKNSVVTILKKEE